MQPRPCTHTGSCAALTAYTAEWRTFGDWISIIRLKKRSKSAEPENQNRGQE